MPTAGLLRAGTFAHWRAGVVAGGASAAEYGGVGVVSAAAAFIAEGQEAGGLFEGWVG